jgi:hypothetical protein
MKRPFCLTSLLVALLLLLTACGGEGNAPGSSGPSSSQTVQVTETAFHIASSRTSFVPGQIYHFLVTNRGKVAHEFLILPRAEGSMSGLPMDKMHRKVLAMIDTIKPGETKALDYTLPSSTANAHPAFARFTARPLTSRDEACCDCEGIAQKEQQEEWCGA